MKLMRLKMEPNESITEFDQRVMLPSEELKSHGVNEEIRHKALTVVFTRGIQDPLLVEVMVPIQLLELDPRRLFSYMHKYDERHKQACNDKPVTPQTAAVRPPSPPTERAAARLATRTTA